MTHSFNTIALSAALIAALACSATATPPAPGPAPQDECTQPPPPAAPPPPLVQPPTTTTVPAFPNPIPPDPPGSPTQPPAGVRVVYVSSSTGSDSGGAGTEASPYRTIQRGLGAMPNGVEAWCLLRRGDTFPDGYTEYRGFGGANATERHVIGAYGNGPLPRVTGQLKFGVGDHPMNFVTVRDLDLPVLGIQQYGYGNDIAFEGLNIVGAQTTGLVIQAEAATKRLSNVAVRNCLVADLRGTSHTHAVYAWGIDGLLVEDNVFDHAVSPITMFCHHLYIQAGNSDVVVRRNAIMRGASSNEFRSGGMVHDNLFIDMPFPMTLGCGTNVESVPGGVDVDVRRNVILGGGDIDTFAGGIAMDVGNIRSGEITGNVIADGKGGWQQLMKVEAGKGVGVLDLRYHHNVRRHWGGGIFMDHGPTTGSSWTETEERPDLYGVDLSLGSFGHTDLFGALRSGAITAVQVNTIVRQRMGIAP